uniref:calycin-like domain-containing protein n=1 Tax=Prevotella sp. TaxID=59823 RepID=UPI0040251E96
MKKLFTLFTMVLMAVSCFATDYTGDLTVTVKPIKGKEDTQTTKGSVVSVNKENGKYTITLKDFKYGSKNLGDIELNKVDATTKKEVTTLTADQQVFITSLLLLVHIKLNGEESNGKFTANIKILNVPFTEISATFDGTDPTYTGISNLPVNNDNEKEEMFNLQGQRISEAKPGQVVIVKKGGKAVKVVK